MSVENRGYIYIAIVMIALACASQIFGGQMGALLGLVPKTVAAPIKTGADAVSGSLSFFGMVIFLLAFVSAPGR